MIGATCGGLLMIPIVICSVLITAIVIERLWTLDAKKVSPKNLVPQIWVWLKNDQLNSTKLKQLRESPIGRDSRCWDEFI